MPSDQVNGGAADPSGPAPQPPAAEPAATVTRAKSDPPPPSDAARSDATDPTSSKKKVDLSKADTSSLSVTHHPHHHMHGSVWKLSIAALGVVFGDIGTSPLYALRECFSPASHISVTAANVLGLLSLFFWSLTLVVTVKYVLVHHARGQRGRGRHPRPARARDPEAAAAAKTGARRARRGALRRSAALRRRHDHAGDLRALRRRGPRGADALHGHLDRSSCSDHPAHPGRAVPRPEARDRERRAASSAPS
jgi:hypothetical protein